MSRDHEQIITLLGELGYEFARKGGGHAIYKRAGFDNFVVPTSPSDHRALKNDLARLRRRHPEHFVSHRRAPEDRVPRQSRKSRDKRDASKSARSTALMVAGAKPRRIERPDVTACAGCGRRWLSRDITPQGRPCVACGGQYIIGKDLAA